MIAFSTILFSIETIHFIIGAIACLIQPEMVVSSYTVMKNIELTPPQQVLNRNIEVTQIFMAFYVSFVLLSLHTTIKSFKLHKTRVVFDSDFTQKKELLSSVIQTTIQFVLFYSILFAYDLRTIYYFFENKLNIHQDRWLIIFVHILMAIIHIASLILLKRQQSKFKNHRL